MTNHLEVTGLTTGTLNLINERLGAITVGEVLNIEDGIQIRQIIVEVQTELKERQS